MKRVAPHRPISDSRWRLLLADRPRRYRLTCSAMFLVRLEYSMPSPRARYTQHELRGADVIITRRRQEGAVVDEAHEQPTTALAETWGRVRIVLDGELFVRRGAGLTLRANEGIAS